MKDIIIKLTQTVKSYDICSNIFAECTTVNEKTHYLYSSNESDIYLSSMKIINMLDKFKYDKIKFINDTHNKFNKYIEFALEECNTTIKLLLSIEKSKIYTKQFDDMVNKITYTEIQRYKYFISLQPVIPPFITIKFRHITCNMLLDSIFSFEPFKITDDLENIDEFEKILCNEIFFNTILRLHDYLYYNNINTKSKFIVQTRRIYSLR